MPTTSLKDAQAVVTTMPAPSLKDAQAVVTSGARIMRHVNAESTNDIEAIMATVTPQEQLSWTPCWTWSAPDVRPDGSIKVQTKTTWEDIHSFYSDNRSHYDVMESGPERTHLARDWYALTESQANFESIEDRSPYKQSWVLMAPLDGNEGITGEIAWGEFPKLAPAESVTLEDKAALLASFISALSKQDTDGLLALMNANVQAAVRDYTGPVAFANIDGQAAMRDYYERLFGATLVRSIEPLQTLVRDWYLFAELRWEVEFTSGPRAGQSGTLLIAEILPLDSDGKIYGRMGYGTELL